MEKYFSTQAARSTCYIKSMQRTVGSSCINQYGKVINVTLVHAFVWRAFVHELTGLIEPLTLIDPS